MLLNSFQQLLFRLNFVLLVSLRRRVEPYQLADSSQLNSIANEPKELQTIQVRTADEWEWQGTKDCWWESEAKNSEEEDVRQWSNVEGAVWKSEGVRWQRRASEYD